MLAVTANSGGGTPVHLRNMTTTPQRPPSPLSPSAWAPPPQASKDRSPLVDLRRTARCTPRQWAPGRTRQGPGVCSPRQWVAHCHHRPHSLCKSGPATGAAVCSSGPPPHPSALLHWARKPRTLARPPLPGVHRHCHCHCHYHPPPRPRHTHTLPWPPAL